MLLILSLATVTTLVSVDCSHNNYFLSVTSGSDDPAVPGSETQPWRSLPYAISRLREIRNWQNPAGPNNTAGIVMRAGTYYLQDRVRLDARDSYLTITSQGEDVKVSGGVVLDVAWQQEGEVRQGEYEGECGELYYGDYRMMKARSPNIAQPGVNRHYGTGPFHTLAGFLVETDDCEVESDKFSQPNCPWENRNGFYLEDEMSPDWEDLDQTLILVYHSWVNEYARVANVTKEEGGRHKVMFQEPLGHAPIGEWIASGNLRYLVTNNRAVLDLPGEYVCTQAGQTARVSWIPPAGAGPGPALNPVMTRVDILLQMIQVQSVNIEGLRLQGTTYTGLDRGMDWSNTALDIRGSADINIVNCEFSQTAMTGIIVYHSSNVLIDRNVLTDIGYHGILTLGGMEFENITITNNYIDGTGITRYWGTGAIFADGSRNVLISNNELTRSMGGALMIKSESLGKDYWAGQEKQEYVVNVEYNYIHDFGVGIISDFGGIKTGSKAKNCDGKSEEELEQSCYTYIRDAVPYYCCGNFLYSDVSSGKTLFENNILYGSGSEALYHHCGLENESRNNIVHRETRPANGEKPLGNLWAGCEKNTGKFQSFTNHHNIYYFEDTRDFTLYKQYDLYDEQTVFSDNLYYSLDPQDEFKGMFPPDSLTFADLPSAGSYDNVWEDPEFADVATHNYRLSDSSPAWEMGIQQIRLDNFGIAKNKKPRYLQN